MLLIFFKFDFRIICGINGDYFGWYIYWGICEYVMVFIFNGFVVFSKGIILLVILSFFMFYMVGSCRNLLMCI